MQGRLNDAKAVIKNVWGASEVEKAIEEFQSVIKNDGSDLDSSWLELLKEPNSRDVGITNSALASLLIGVTNFAGALCALYLIDKQGRLKLLIGSYLGMQGHVRLRNSVYVQAVSMFLVVCAISFPLDEQLSDNLSILGTVMYIFTFAIGAGPVTGLIIPELSSNRSRGKIMGFSFSAHWVCNFLVGLFFLDLVEKFGVAPVYGTFGAVSLLAAIFATYFIVETKGRSLEEIEMSLSSDFMSRDKVTLGVSFSTLQESRLHGIVITYRNFTSRPLKDAISLCIVLVRHSENVVRFHGFTLTFKIAWDVHTLVTLCVPPATLSALVRYN
ncbi:Major facilitator superfamily protein [Prunus dulcis]|uniref:Major facilitator superfamily protein n=1 Tax=Prunus dulcis TaxID=3755 RepID=A0A4Y1R732_PRUDU|nr:Major facilitator superfamily protein [Prunus dulcis]